MSKPVRIIRATKDRENPYKQVRRGTFDGSGLSFEARGVLAYVLMKPDDWELQITDIMREGNIGRDKAYRIIDELIAAGYAERVDGRDEHGKFGHNTILIHEQPCTENPHTEKPYPAKPYPENPDHTNNSNSTKKGKKLNSETTIVASQPTPQQEMFGAVCEAIGWDYQTLSKDDRGQVAQAVSILQDARYGVDDIRTFMMDVWFNDWRWKDKAQHPTLKQLRQEIGKIRSVVKAHAPRQRTNMDDYREMLARQGIQL